MGYHQQNGSMNASASVTGKASQMMNRKAGEKHGGGLDVMLDLIGDDEGGRRPTCHKIAFSSGLWCW